MHNNNPNESTIEDFSNLNIKKIVTKTEDYNLETFLNKEKYYYFNSKVLYHYLATSRLKNIRIRKILTKKNLKDFKHFTIEIYLKKFISDFNYFNCVINYNGFNYFFINESRKQSFVSILNEKKISQLTYSTGLVLCALGFKKNNTYKTLKKQYKGFLKYFNYSKILIIPKLIRKLNKKNTQMGIVITGRGKFTKSYVELTKYFEKIMRVNVMFLLWIPKLRFSFVKLRKYARIKRNFRKRIIRTLMLSEKLKNRKN